MEILRKRSYSLYSDDGKVSSSGHVQFECYNPFVVNGENGCKQPQKRLCNGITSYLSQDGAMGCTGDWHQQPPETYTRIDNEVTMETIAPSCHSHIPVSSMQDSNHVLSPAGDASNVMPHHLQTGGRKVCQRCLAGEPGHITHIVR